MPWPENASHVLHRCNCKCSHDIYIKFDGCCGVPAGMGCCEGWGKGSGEVRPTLTRASAYDVILPGASKKKLFGLTYHARLAGTTRTKRLSFTAAVVERSDAFFCRHLVYTGGGGTGRGARSTGIINSVRVVVA